MLAFHAASPSLKGSLSPQPWGLWVKKYTGISHSASLYHHPWVGAYSGLWFSRLFL